MVKCDLLRNRLNILYTYVYQHESYHPYGFITSKRGLYERESSAIGNLGYRVRGITGLVDMTPSPLVAVGGKIWS